jgi:hypothetical protein
MLLARLLALVMFLYLAFGQRFVFSAGTGGRGIVSPLELLFVALAFGTALWFKGRPFQVLTSRTVLQAYGPLFGLLLLFPLMGVVSGGYEVRTLYSWMLVLVPVALLVTGVTLRGRGINMAQVIYAAIVTHGVYGLGQMLYRLGILPEAVWGWASKWDTTTQAAYSEAYVIYGRSTGLMVNANLFGWWSVLAVLFGWTRLSGVSRVLAVTLGAVGVAGSQSRTAWAALAVIGVVALARMAVTPAGPSRFVRALVWVAPVVIVVGWLGVFTPLLEGDLINRLSSGAQVLDRGIAADDNLALRTEAWAQASEFAASHPFGTWGPPQAQFGGFIDNQAVSLYLQGGLLLVLAYAWMLLNPLFLAARRVPGAGTLGLMMLGMAITSLTALPLESPLGSGILWGTVALSLAAWPVLPINAAARPRQGVVAT